ncbi:UNKNOWN [Stylonychia lemnae]|uniref:Uncharacterized protein n=1 Tax=Stylonychia lemnae TaxID=5949 RepID=A0A077ZVT4_STYLE|nr:UNKNOWN [Stylonychia lemnae]|eukprot:CDW73984.1 UNKNOWN [Stylonychia lemnae]
MLEQTEKDLQGKLQWLLENVSTHPRYIQEVQSTNQQLIKLEIQIESNNNDKCGQSARARQNLLTEKVMQMRKKLDKTTNEVMKRIEQINFDISTHKVASLFVVDNLEFIQILVKKISLDLVDMKIMDKKTDLMIQYPEGEGNETIVKDICKIIPQYQNLNYISDQKVKIRFRNKIESKLAFDIIKVITGKYNEDDELQELTKDLLGKKRLEKQSKETPQQVLLQNVKQIMTLIQIDDDVQEQMIQQKHANTTAKRLDYFDYGQLDFDSPRIDLFKSDNKQNNRKPNQLN